MMSDGAPMKELTPLPTRGGGSLRVLRRVYGAISHGTRPTFADLRDPVARFDAKRFFLKIRAAALLLVRGDVQ